MDEAFQKALKGQPGNSPEIANDFLKSPSSSVSEPVMTQAEPLKASTDNSPVAAAQIMPVPVVRVLSTRGLEYAMLTITLWLNAIGLLWILLALVNGGAKFDILAVPLSIMIVSVPVFAYLFLRRKKAELADPSLKLEPSKRRWTQLTQIIAFLAIMANLISFVYFILAHFGGQVSYSIFKGVLDVAIVLSVTGGILVYYWHDEHRTNQA